MNTTESLKNSLSTHRISNRYMTVTEPKHSDIIHFPLTAEPRCDAQKGWVCNLSSRYMFSQQRHEYLQIQSSKQHSQFDLICRLLDANTCRVIYFDENLTQGQLALVRERHILSKTELIHAKVAFMFGRNISTLHA